MRFIGKDATDEKILRSQLLTLKNRLIALIRTSLSGNGVDKAYLEHKPNKFADLVKKYSDKFVRVFFGFESLVS